MQNVFFGAGGAEQLGPINILINLVLALILCFIVAVVYKRTHHGLSYSQSFVFTLILGGMVIAGVMMVIGNSLARAFGAFGAFSLIRFRTAVKDAKDMAYIFLVLAIGMAVGTNNYLIAILITLFALLIIIILTKVNFGSIRKYDYILSFFFNTEVNTSENYKKIFDKYLKTSDLLHIDAKDGGKILKLTFNIRFFSAEESNVFLNQLSQVAGVSEANLINVKSDIEY